MPPFHVLSVCMGNICRSPMAERLLLVAAGEVLAGRSTVPASAGSPPVHTLLYSASAGTGGWHVGQPMNPPAARQVRRRGGDDAGFAARRLSSAHLDSADLVLTATVDQAEYVCSLRPDATARTFVLGEFGRLLAKIDRYALPPADLTRDAVHARGLALVTAADAARAGARPLVGDDLDDPYGRGNAFFGRVADDIEAVTRPLAAVLLSAN